MVREPTTAAARLGLGLRSLPATPPPSRSPPSTPSRASRSDPAALLLLLFLLLLLLEWATTAKKKKKRKKKKKKKKKKRPSRALPSPRAPPRRPSRRSRRCALPRTASCAQPPLPPPLPLPPLPLRRRRQRTARGRGGGKKGRHHSLRFPSSSPPPTGARGRAPLTTLLLLFPLLFPRRNPHLAEAAAAATSTRARRPSSWP